MKRYLTMKQLISFLAALLFVLSLPGGLTAEETEDGDDSEQIPVETMEEDDIEIEESVARVLQYGDEGDDVLELQTRLTELKYYKGNLSGRYREGTRAAVKAFQKDFELEETGVADIQTQQILYTTLYRPLRYGSDGEDVKNLQTRLTELGYYKGKISGDYLDATQRAVERFQERNGLEVTGVADPETQQMIFDGKAIGKNDETPVVETPEPTPDMSGYVVKDEEDDTPVAIPDNPPEFKKNLKSGSSGTRVKELQQRMTDLGYYTGPISGNYMRNTVRAVKKVQEQNGLKVTGVVDKETWDVIFTDPEIVMPDNTPRPTPSPTPVPFHIVVDVANQVTTVYGRDENGDYTVVVHHCLCSTGKKGTPSDVGDWVLNGRHAQWCVFPKWGNSYARYWTRINSNIAFHSPIYTAVSNQAMNISSYKMLGKRASHGCIRLSVPDARWIYENIGEGTVVSIVENMDRDPELVYALRLPEINTKTCEPKETPQPTPEPEYRSDVKPVMETRVLKKKDESPVVFWVQKRLTELGYYKGWCGGKILDGTVNALKNFQRDQGVYPSGEIYPETIDLLYNAGRATVTVKTEAAP